MPKIRPKNSRNVPNKMHIYCEGEKTEPNYLNSYLESLKDAALRDIVKIENTKKNTPVQLVDGAISIKKSKVYPPGDVFWVVYDRESPAKYSDQLHEKAYQRALSNGIEVALSNVCFEQWLMLHFTSSDAAYTCYDDLITRSCLKPSFKRLSGKDYDKGCPEIYSHIEANIGIARERAKAINKRTLESAPAGSVRPFHLNPYTDIPKLLDAIDAFGKKDEETVVQEAVE